MSNLNTLLSTNVQCNQNYDNENGRIPTNMKKTHANDNKPKGYLIDNKELSNKESLISKSASIRRTFGPLSNAEAMLTLGGPSLAANASFDPQYNRAREWIHHHAVGPTVQSPVLLNGLIGALVEATFPSSIVLSNNMRNIRPLIVGVSTS